MERLTPATCAAAKVKSLAEAKAKFRCKAKMPGEGGQADDAPKTGEV